MTKRKAQDDPPAQRRTRAAKRHAASQPVFAVPQMLEMILLHVSMKQLFVLQRVNSNWRDNNSKSPARQMKLFLQPSARPIRPVLSESENEENFQLYTTNLRLNPAAGMWRIWGDPKHAIVGKDKTTNVGAWIIGQMDESEIAVFFELGTFQSLNHYTARQQRTGGQSWEKMLLHQPPVVVVQLTHHIETETGEDSVEHHICNQAGLTWGDLHRGVEEFEVQYRQERRKDVPNGTVNLGFRAGLGWVVWVPEDAPGGARLRK
ncbi:hypothetical protein M409DRAFT_22264 [Zasmidium cellare ATCC 36951]|uniref:F-box domain-containing protein n=1 Tax=Zasmidium cellare ATCC 36951 TaxID=1080233 RepID=A0A6A6CPR0_ZASCE|nr:uncharacterized protein M409DRAFT_22264 [Zasmidium cellare ATCC 36951]KAF2167456.1 hypothetical protein M409DRAFT_22264 [Zasmidium cellare ATCC 36951]